MMNSKRIQQQFLMKGQRNLKPWGGLERFMQKKELFIRFMTGQVLSGECPLT